MDIVHTAERIGCFTASSPPHLFVCSSRLSLDLSSKTSISMPFCSAEILQSSRKIQRLQSLFVNIVGKEVGFQRLSSPISSRVKFQVRKKKRISLFFITHESNFPLDEIHFVVQVLFTNRWLNAIERSERSTIKAIVTRSKRSVKPARGATVSGHKLPRRVTVPRRCR